MKITHWILLIIVIMASAWLIIQSSDTEPRIEENIDLNWKFILQDDSLFRQTAFDDSEWENVSLPHDWMITQQIDKSNPSGTAGGFYPGGVGWYRKHIDFTKYKSNDQFYLVFEGVYMNADVWINGNYVSGHKYGYIGFDLDITPYIRKDTINIIAVRTDCSEMPFDRWYSGAGIYRHVKLIATVKLHFPVLNNRIITNSSGNDRVMTSEIEIINNDRRSKRFKIKSVLLSPEGKMIRSTILSKTIEGRSTMKIKEEKIIPDPEFWSLDNPVQYELRTFLIQRKKVIDQQYHNFGVRDIEFLPDSGFILNGRKVWLKGVCIHHDGGALGAAVPDATWEYRLKKLKDLGVNALRLAHNPHSPEVLNLCDKMGILVIDEMYDKWEMKWKYTNGDFDFTKTFKSDLAYFIKRDMNHPSVIAWSMGNETVEQLEDPKSGVEWYTSLADLTHEIDSSRSITCALHPGYFKQDEEITTSSYIFVEPLVSYNYRTDFFKEWHEKYPKIIWLASETKPYDTNRKSDYNVISYKENSWSDMDTFVAGQFIWAGIDYLGETAGWPYRSFNNGLLKTNAEVKPFAYYTQSIYSEKPMVKIVVVDKNLVDSLNRETNWQISWSGAPVVRHWNFKEQNGELQVVVYTNCKQVELSLNDSLYGKFNTQDFDDKVIKTNIKFRPGIISAKAFFRNEVGETSFIKDSIVTAGSPAMIIMEPDKNEFYADGKDVVHIKTRVADSLGITYSSASNEINYDVKGPGHIKVIDNGNPRDHASYEASKKSVYEGTHLVILQSNLEPGDLTISASAIGLQSASLRLKSIPLKK